MTSRFALFLSILITLLSCSEEKITEEVKARSPITQQSERGISYTDLRDCQFENCQYDRGKDQYLKIKGSYNVTTFDVDKPINNGPQIFEDLGNLFVDVLLRLDGNFEVEMDAIPFEIPDIDFNILKIAKIKSVNFEIEDPNSKAMLDFIEKIKISAVDPNSDNKRILLLETSYKQDSACWGKCIKGKAKDINLIDFLNDAKKIMIVPELKIGKAPLEKFKIKVSIDFEVGVALPF